MENKYILLGGGGFAIELYEFMQADNQNVVGYYAQEDNKELSTFIPWLGDMDNTPYDAFDREAQYILAVRLLKYRDKFIQFMEKMDLTPGTFISSKAYFSKLAKIGKGAVAYPSAMITGNPVVGDYLFMDVFSIISHGNVMGDNIVIGPGVIVTGDTKIGDNVTFGANSAVLPGTKIGNNVEIAINSYPKRRVPDGSSILTPPGQNFGIDFNQNF